MWRLATLKPVPLKDQSEAEQTYALIKFELLPIDPSIDDTPSFSKATEALEVMLAKKQYEGIIEPNLRAATQLFNALKQSMFWHHQTREAVEQNVVSAVECLNKIVDNELLRG